MKGNVGIIAIVGILLGSVLLLMVLVQITDPLTNYQPVENGQLANLTAFGYVELPAPADNYKVFNNTDCVTDELAFGSDYMTDTPYNGGIGGTGTAFVAGIHGYAINFTTIGDYVAVSDAPNLNGDFTLTGWINPTN